MLATNHKAQVNGQPRPLALDFNELTCPIGELWERLRTSEKGLSEKEAQSRLAIYGYNEPAKKRKRTILT
ncbi:MAG: hypothetical protein HYZ73_02220, partial [Elusimicrobia bacterium]|nr:hypothetical protein [Elusimicrobiota bacterium]